MTAAMRMVERLLGVIEGIKAGDAVSRARLANIEDRLAHLDGGACADLAKRQAIQAVIDNGGPSATYLNARRSP